MAITPPKAFVSHIHEERALGALVKEWVEGAFTGHSIEAFLSSDQDDLPAGRKALEVIQQELTVSRVMVSLLSPTSLARPWVNIELGAAWVKGLHVIPLCHSGLKFANLGRPFGDFHGVDLQADDAAERLLGGVADGFGLPRPRKLAFMKCLQEMRTAAAKSERASISAVGIPEEPNLAAEQIEILQLLAAAADHGAKDVPEVEAIRASGLKASVYKHHAEELRRKKLVHQNYYGNSYRFSILPDGTGWLIKNRHLPD